MEKRDVVGTSNVNLPFRPVLNVCPRAHDGTRLGLGLLNDRSKVGEHNSCPIPFVGFAIENVEVVAFHCR